MYGLNWVFIIENQFIIASNISIIVDISILSLLTLIVAVLNYNFQKVEGDKRYRHKKQKTDKRKQLENELKKRGFDPENLKDYLKE